MKAIGSLIVFVAAVFGVAAFGAQFAPGEWYEGLVKPAGTPPNWLFGPVWTLLYSLIALSGWLVFRKAGPYRAPLPFVLYVFQLVLNGAWSWIFFGLQNPGVALAGILVLWIVILGTAILFWRVSALAGALLLPYLVWVGFAAWLNWKIWELNA